MTHFCSELAPRSPFSDCSIDSTEGRGLTVTSRDGLGITVVLMRKGCHQALAQRVRDRFHMELPRGACRTEKGQLAFAGTGPGAWLAIDDRSGNRLSVSLREALSDVASVIDQSDGYAVLRLSGPNVRDTLAKLVPIDLHPRAFDVGTVAATLAGHIGVTLWRLENDASGLAVFEIAVLRSFAICFWEALAESAGSLTEAVPQAPSFAFALSVKTRGIRELS